jgi:MFS family permease
MYLWFVLVGHFDEVFPVKVMLIGPLLSFIGGSEATIMSVAAAIITDIAPDEAQRYLACTLGLMNSNNVCVRASFFAYVGSLAYISSMLGPAIAAFTMSFNLWLPFWLGISMLLLAIPTILFLETVKYSLRGIVANLPESEPLLPQGSVDRKPLRWPNSLRYGPARLYSFYNSIWSKVASRPNFRVLLAVFLLASLASSNTPILPQYLSKRFSITFAQAGVILSIKALTNVVLLILVVPSTVAFMLNKRRMAGVLINFYGAELTLAVSVIGAILIAVSFNIWILIFCNSSFHLQSKMS